MVIMISLIYVTSITGSYLFVDVVTKLIYYYWRKKSASTSK